MEQKKLARLAVLAAVAWLPATVAAQSAGAAGGQHPNPPAAVSSAAARQPTAVPPTGEDDFPPPRITVVNPAPQPSPWTLRDKIAWTANLLLVLLGYAGILVAVSTLKKIQRQAEQAGSAAEAAAASAQAALLNAQAVIHAERPWILITVEPSPNRENCFSILATNRGRSPAKIVARAEQIRIVMDEKHLPTTPEYKDGEPQEPLLAPIILVPGESALIKSICREDVKGLCESQERFQRIEQWEEKIYLYGKVIYLNLIAPAGSQALETHWCCWYIHGQKKSGLVPAGPPAYHAHT
ncbi:MAG: hypothetical protein ACP5FH_01640 [Terracidiphilus sp.]